VVLVYSVTDRKSFNNLENWIKQINESQPESMCKVIVGNKVDCKETERQVSFAEGNALATKYGVPFVECSAKDNYNITEIFSTIGKPIKERLVEGENSKGNGIKIQANDVKSKGDKKNCEC
jgi:Ras-related protein Rab-8A